VEEEGVSANKIYINLTDEAYAALVAWRPEAVEAAEPSPRGGYELRVYGHHLQAFNRLQRSGKNYSDLILRAAREGLKA
jgi:hypothetical protein